MGLLRASVDAIIVGARTVHDVSPDRLWVPEYTYPDAKDFVQTLQGGRAAQAGVPARCHCQWQRQVGTVASSF